MSSRNRTAKSLEQKLVDLDAHLYLLRQNLGGLRESAGHLKVIAAELRTLLCKSSGTDGLLWRLVDELKVSDFVALHLPGKLKRDHPLVQGLEFMVVPIWRAGKGDPRLVPDDYSFREIIKEGEALVALGKPLTHEYLIKAVSQQMGTAHEDDGLEPALVQLSRIFVNGVEPYQNVLAMDAVLTIEVAERVLSVAESRGLLRRTVHSQDYGNLSVVIRGRRRPQVGDSGPLFRFHSYASDVDIVGIGTPGGIAFRLSKRRQLIREVLAPFPASAAVGKDVIAVLSYCSRTSQVRTVTAAGPSGSWPCALGWLHAIDLEQEALPESRESCVDQSLLLIYERLLPTEDVLKLLALPPDGYGLWKPIEELRAQGPFPQ